MLAMLIGTAMTSCSPAVEASETATETVDQSKDVAADANETVESNSELLEDE